MSIVDATVEIYLKTGEILRVSGEWKNRPRLSGFHSSVGANSFEDISGNVYLIADSNISYVKILKEKNGKQVQQEGKESKSRS